MDEREQKTLTVRAEEASAPDIEEKTQAQAKPVKYKLNAMQCYTRVLKVIKQKNAFKDRKKLSALLKKLSAEVKETL